MEDQRRQVHGVAAQRGGEQRVVEPPQGGEGRRRAEVHVHPLRGEPIRLALRHPRVEEALVGNPPDDRIPPGVRADAVLRGGREHQQQRIAPDVRECRVGLPRFEADVIGEIPGIPDQGKPALRVRRRLRVGDQLVQGLGLLEDRDLLEAGTSQVADIVAQDIRRAKPEEERRRGDEEPHADPSPSHRVQRTPKRWVTGSPAEEAR